MSNSKDPTWSLALIGCTLLVLAAFVGRSAAKEVHEEDNDKAIDDKHSGELGDSHKMRRSVELSAGNFGRLFKRASGDVDGGDGEDKPRKSKKKKKSASTTTTSAPSTSSKAPSTTDKPAGSTTKAPSSGDKSPTTTTTGKPGSTTTTAKPSMTPKKQDSADLIKSQEDEANILTNIENSLSSWDKWLSDHNLTLNRHFALEVYHHMRRIVLMQGIEHQKHQKPNIISGPTFIHDGNQIISLPTRQRVRPNILY